MSLTKLLWCFRYYLLLAALGLYALIWFEMYRLGLKVEVYKRQGIEVSRWELFMGAEPAPMMRTK